jgi:hypothetical protein
MSVYESRGCQIGATPTTARFLKYLAFLTNTGCHCPHVNEMANLRGFRFVGIKAVNPGLAVLSKEGGQD